MASRDRRRRRWGGVVVAGALVLAFIPVTEMAASAASCTSTQLVPQVRLTDVNQGLAGYAQPLVYGKDTLVKLFLSMPGTCTTTGQTLWLDAGSTLRIDDKDSTGKVLASNTVTATLPATPNPSTDATQLPTIVGYSAAPALNPTSAGDLVFSVPGSALAPPPPTGSSTGPAFTASFTATIKYRQQLSATASIVSASTTPAASTASFDHESNALRVLIEPMGDASSTQTQFTTGAQQSVQNAMVNESRLLPVKSGVSSLIAPVTTGPPPGIRYTINAGLLDLGTAPGGLGLIQPGQKFCGTASNFAAIRDKLNSTLATYNQLNPSATASRILGVIDETVSNGGNAGCYEGVAHVNGAEAWTRAFWQPSSPAWTGALVGMELGHTLGLTPQDPNGTTVDCTNFTGDGGWHSLNVSADNCSTNHAYNVGTTAFLANDRSVMKLSDAYWSDSNVVYEKQDYLYAQCVLGGTSTYCKNPAPSPANVGGFSPAAQASDHFIISGEITVNTDGTSTANVEDSYVASTTYETSTDSNSRWSIAYLDSSTPPHVLLQEGVPVNFNGSSHCTGPSCTSSSQVGSFVSSRPKPSGTTHVQLLDGTTVLYQRDLNGAPQITSTTQTANNGPVVEGTPTNLTNTSSASESRPALSGTGIVVWAASSGLVAANVPTPPAAINCSATPSPCFPISGTANATNPSFSRDGTKLTYEQNGDIDIVPVLTTTPPSFGPVTTSCSSTTGCTVYRGVVVAAPAHHPSFSPDGTALAIEVGGSIYGVYPQGTTNTCVLPGVLTGSCAPFTSSGSGGNGGGGDSSPSWSPDSSNRVAFVRGTGISTVVASSTANGTGPVSLLIDHAADPSWGAGLLAFTSNGTPTGGAVNPISTNDIWIVDPNTPTAPQQLTHLGADARSSLAWSATGGQVAYERQFVSGSTNQSDIMVLPLQPNTPTPTNTYTLTATDDGGPANLRAEFSRKCADGHQEVLASALTPNDVSGGEARFQMSLNPGTIPNLGCAGGSVSGSVSDGFSTSSAPAGSVSGGSAQPVASIVSPTTGSTFQSNQDIVLIGAGYDADNQTLPASSLSWSVTGVSGTRTGSRVELTLAPGTYTATLTATDANGTQGTSQTTFTVTAPPKTAYTATVNFSPGRLNAPALSGDSQWVSVEVILANPNLKQIDPKSVVISQIGSYNKQNDPSFPTLVGGCIGTTCTAANSWTVDGSYPGDQDGDVKFDRIAIENYLASKGILTGYVPITIFGSAPTWTFSGADPINPIVN